jgi:hypothetical protein
MASRRKTTTKVARATKELAKDTGTAASRRAEALLELIARRKQTITEAFYDIGEALREILKKKLYGALGFGSFEKLLTARKVISASTAYQLIDVVDSLPRDKALSLGAEKSYALARFAAATSESDPPSTLVDEGVPIGPRGKRIPATKISVRELEEATRKVRAKKHGKRDLESSAADARAHAAAKKLAKQHGVEVKADARKRGKVWWAVVELPLDALETLR